MKFKHNHFVDECDKCWKLYLLGRDAGYKQALDDFGVVHGKDAIKFLKNTGLNKTFFKKPKTKSAQLLRPSK